MKKGKKALLEPFNEMMLVKLYSPLAEFHDENMSVQVFVADEINKNGLPEDTMKVISKSMKQSVSFCVEDGKEVAYYGNQGDYMHRDYNLFWVYRCVFVEDEEVFHFQVFIYGYQEGRDVSREMERLHFNIDEARLKDHFSQAFYPYDSRNYWYDYDK